MFSYLWAFLLVLVENAMPAFSPPTWLVLVYLSLGFSLEPIPLIILAVVAACLGHWFMANGLRRVRHKLPKRYVANLEALGSQIVARGKTSWGLFVLFLISPLSSGQLFAAAGLMPQVRLLPLTLVFGIGRCFTYTSYVLGAHAFVNTDLGARFVEEMTSPWALVSQTVLLAGLVGLGMVKWKHVFDES